MTIMNTRHLLPLCLTLFLLLIRTALPGARPDFALDPLGSLDQQFVIVLAMPEEGLRYGDPTKDLLANQRRMRDILIGTYPQCSHRLPTDEFGFAILTLNQSCPGDSISFVPISDKWRLASKRRVLKFHRQEFNSSQVKFIPLVMTPYQQYDSLSPMLEARKEIIQKRFDGLGQEAQALITEKVQSELRRIGLQKLRKDPELVFRAVRHEVGRSLRPVMRRMNQVMHAGSQLVEIVRKVEQQGPRWRKLREKIKKGDLRSSGQIINSYYRSADFHGRSIEERKNYLGVGGVVSLASEDKNLRRSVHRVNQRQETGVKSPSYEEGEIDVINGRIEPRRIRTINLTGQVNLGLEVAPAGLEVLGNSQLFQWGGTVEYLDFDEETRYVVNPIAYGVSLGYYLSNSINLELQYRYERQRLGRDAFLSQGFIDQHGAMLNLSSHSCLYSSRKDYGFLGINFATTLGGGIHKNQLDVTAQQLVSSHPGPSEAALSFPQNSFDIRLGFDLQLVFRRFSFSGGYHIFYSDFYPAVGRRSINTVSGLRYFHKSGTSALQCRLNIFLRK